MKVILQKDIPNLGDAGDIKEVAEGFARNYLLPKKLVIVANESSKKAIEHQKKLIKIKKDKRKKTSEELAAEHVRHRTHHIRHRSAKRENSSVPLRQWI